MVEHAGIASAFLADVFGCSTAEPVYISSLPNDDARGREPGERHVVTREMANIEAFTRKWDRKDRALYFCTATIKIGSTRRSKETIAELMAEECAATLRLRFLFCFLIEQCGSAFFSHTRCFFFAVTGGHCFVVCTDHGRGPSLYLWPELSVPWKFMVALLAPNSCAAQWNARAL